MARPGLHKHPKFRRFVAAMQLPYPFCHGLLECLWETGYADGNPLVGDAQDIALACGYTEDPTKLVTALLDSGGPTRAGFIEPAGDGTYQIHDLLDNAPDYVRARARMHRWRQSKRKNDVTVTNNSEQLHTVTQPLRNGYGSNSPAQPSPAQPRVNTSSSASPTDGGFARFWSAWPKHFRKTSRKQCERKWIAQKLDGIADRIVTSVERHKETEQWKKQGGQFIPGPLVWLNRQGWEASTDEAEEDSDPGWVRRVPTPEELVAMGISLEAQQTELTPEEFEAAADAQQKAWQEQCRATK